MSIPGKAVLDTPPPMLGASPARPRSSSAATLASVPLRGGSGAGCQVNGAAVIGDPRDDDARCQRVRGCDEGGVVSLVMEDEF